MAGRARLKTNLCITEARRHGKKIKWVLFVPPAPLTSPRPRANVALSREDAMPNGGPDNCARCGFNKPNDGRWPGPGEEQESPGFCTIRGIAVDNPFWTYCKNQHSRQSEPQGPVYGAVYTQGYQRVPWYDSMSPCEGEATCHVCGDHVLTGILLPFAGGGLEFCG